MFYISKQSKHRKAIQGQNNYKKKQHPSYSDIDNVKFCDEVFKMSTWT